MPRGVLTAPHRGTIVVTRAQEQAGALVDGLQGLGFAVQCYPVLRVIPAADDGAALAQALTQSWDYLLLTSANALRAVLAQGRPRYRCLAVVGPACAAAAQEAGLRVDMLAPQGDAESLLAELIQHAPAGARMLLPQAENARPLLREGLRDAGFSVAAVVAYRSLAQRPPQQLARDVVAVTLASSATVGRFIAAIGAVQQQRLLLRHCQWLAIGRHTAAACRRQGLAPLRIAPEPTVEGLLRLGAGLNAPRCGA